MYFANVANSAYNCYLRNRSILTQDLHNTMLTVSSLHASLIMAQSTAADAIDTIAFLSELWDENTDHINEWFQSYTAPIIGFIQGIVNWVMADRTTVKVLSDEVLDEIEQDRQEIQQHAYITHEVVQGFIQAYILSPSTEVAETVTQSLDDLKQLAKSLKIKGYNLYKCPIKLEAKIAEVTA